MAYGWGQRFLCYWFYRRNTREIVMWDFFFRYVEPVMFALLCVAAVATAPLWLSLILLGILCDRAFR